MSARVGTPWGWHALTAEAAADLVDRAGIRRRDLVVDIGAGDGAITEHLVRAGALVVAVELHPGRCEVLRERFGRWVVVVRADASDLRLPRRPFRVVANPPFAVTTPLLRRLLSQGSRLVDAHLVLQRQAATRWVHGAAPGAGRWAEAYDLRVDRVVPRTAFRARPPVDCVELAIRRR